jgi:hypothetical protein
MALAQRRIRLLFGAFAALLAIAAVRTLELGTLQSAHLSAIATQQQVQTQALPAVRGEILDRNGAALALTEPADDISATPYQIKDPASAAARLAPLLGESVATLTQQLAARTTFVYLKRQVPDTAAQQIAALGIAGISLTTDNIRDYPFGDLAAQLLGGTHLGGGGADGLELELNGALAGVSGTSRTVVAADGTPISVSDPRKAVPGETVRLTLDARLQQEVETVLAGVGQEYTPEDATAIVMTPSTGAVLALANWPSVNANDAGTGFDWSDHAIALNYEPGSTFKAVVIGGALSDGLITPNTMFNIPSSLPFDGRVINDSTAHPDETLDDGDPRPVEQHRGGQDRAEAGRRSLRLLGQALRLRLTDRDRSARREPGDHPAAQRLQQLLDGQPALRTGRVGHADPDRHGLRGDRQRRHPASAARRRADREHGPARARRSSNHQPAGRRRAAHDARRSPRARRHGVRDHDPRLPARRQDRHRQQGDPDAALGTERGRSSGRALLARLRQPRGRAGDAVLLRPGTAQRRSRSRRRRGAARRRALVVERPLARRPELRVASVRAAMAPLAARFYGDPSAELRVVGVTGTNGKTTTTFLIRALLEAAGSSAACSARSSR